MLIRIFVCIFFFGISLASCSQPPEITKQLEGNTYGGIHPCADCEGIFYQLLFDEEQQYELLATYIGESNRPFVEKGSWSAREDTVVVLEEGGETRQYALVDSHLVALDREEEIVRDNYGQTFDLRQRQFFINDENWAEKRGQGIDFRASGNEPFWMLDINFEDSVTFKEMMSDSFQVETPPMNTDLSSGVRVLRPEQNVALEEIRLHPVGCIDSMSGFIFSHAVEVQTEEETYRGCGNYINDRFIMHDDWTLSSVNSSDLDTEKPPRLIFDMVNNRIRGFTGCNELSGRFATEDSSLLFEDPITTKKACPGNMEQQFLKQLKIVNRYKIEHEVLLMMEDEEVLMKFHRTGT